MHPQKSHIRLNTRLLPVLCIVALILALVDGYRGWTILLVSTGGVWLFSYLWAIALARGVSIHREMRYGWAQVGDRLEEYFTLTNRAPIPALWVEVIGQTNMPDYWANQVRHVKRRGETRWQIKGICTRRGLYTLGPTTLQTNDPFGVYTVTLFDPAATTLMVMPPIIPLPSIEVAPGGRTGDGPPRANAPELTVSTTTVREYVPGDSPRWIHWPTTARREEFFVRVFEGAPAGDWWIVLDLQRDVQKGVEDQSTSEHGIILAASLTDLGMRAGHAVGLVAHGDTLAWHRPSMSDPAKWAILRSLALLEPGTVSLAELLTLARPSMRKNASLIVITPDVRGQWLAPLMEVRRVGTVPTVMLFDPLTFGGTENSNSIHAALVAQGIHHKILSRDQFNHRATPTVPPPKTKGRIGTYPRFGPLPRQKRPAGSDIL